LSALINPARAQQVKAEDFALQLQRIYQRNGYDITVTFRQEENALVLRSDEFRDAETREATAREVGKNAKTMCPLGIWYLKVGYHKGFLDDITKTVSLGCPAAKSARIAETAAAREEFSKICDDPDGSGSVHCHVEGTILVIVSERFFDNPQLRAYTIHSMSQTIRREPQKLCDAQFTKLQFKGKNLIKTETIACH